MEVVGVFTEHDYFDKVLNASHSAVRSSKVCEVATMGSELVIAHPEDTVEGCLEVMTKKVGGSCAVHAVRIFVCKSAFFVAACGSVSSVQFSHRVFCSPVLLYHLRHVCAMCACANVFSLQNLSAIPVVKHDGHIMGTVSVMDLTREMFSSSLHHTTSMGAAMATMFTEPSHFPENIMAAGGGYHDDISASLSSPKQLQELYDQLKHDLETKVAMNAEMPPTPSFDSAAAERFNLDPNLDERAAESFSEASVFPEYTPSEDELFTQTHGAADPNLNSSTAAEIWLDEDKYELAQSSLLDEMKNFSEPSDFPECLTVEEAIEARKRREMAA